MVVTKYYCSVCGEEYDDAVEAMDCENRIPTKNYQFKVGDIHEVSGNYDYIRIIGQWIKQHNICPVILCFKMNEDDWKIGTSSEGYYTDLIEESDEWNNVRIRSKEVLEKIKFDMNMIKECEF